MNNLRLKAVPSVLVLIGATTLAPNAAAHEGTDSLARPKSSIDTNTLNCDTDAQQLSVQVTTLGQAKQPKVSVMAIGPNGGTKISTDPVNGDANPSPAAIVADGPGTYWIVIFKSGKGAKTYDLTYHCEGANGAHAGQGLLTPLQDQ